MVGIQGHLGKGINIYNHWWFSTNQTKITLGMGFPKRIIVSLGIITVFVIISYQGKTQPLPYSFPNPPSKYGFKTTLQCFLMTFVHVFLWRSAAWLIVQWGFSTISQS